MDYHKNYSPYINEHKKELNKEMIGPYLTFSFTPGERTFFKDVYKVLPGHYIKIDVKSLKVEDVSYFKSDCSTTDKSYDKIVDEISNSMKDSVRHHLISDVEVGFVSWPLSVIRLRSDNQERLVELGDIILNSWRGYSDEELGIFAHTDDVPHNTITPIARFKNGKYELDLVLRNNKTSDEHPDGIYHPHKEYHHLKKENIGLIEVMGLAVLPGRLKDELEVVKDALVSRETSVLAEAGLEKHSPWLKELLERYNDVTLDEVDEIMKHEVGEKFVAILECCGVYKLTEEGLEGIQRFINSINCSL